MKVHLHQPKIPAFEAFATDPEWRGEPFWMLNTFRYKPDSRAAQREYAKRMDGVLDTVGARVVFQAGVAATAPSPDAWDAVAIVAYPNPAAFIRMATSDALERASAPRIASFLDQLLIPVSPGWRTAAVPDVDDEATWTLELRPDGAPSSDDSLDADRQEAVYRSGRAFRSLIGNVDFASARITRSTRADDASRQLSGSDHPVMTIRPRLIAPAVID